MASSKLEEIIKSKRFLAGLLVAIIAISGVTVYFLSGLFDGDGEFDPFEAVSSGSEEDDTQVNAEFIIPQEEFFFYKGDNINFTLELQILNHNAIVETVVVGVTDTNLSRSAEQSISIDEKFEPGIYSLNLSLSPGFEENGFVTLGYNNYTLDYFKIFYRGFLKTDTYVKNLDLLLLGKRYETVNRIVGAEWNVPLSQNHTLEIIDNTIQINSTEETGVTTLYTTLNLEAATKLSYYIHRVFLVSVRILLNNVTKEDYNRTGAFDIELEHGSIFVGNDFNHQELRIEIETVNFENVTIELDLFTKHIPLFLVVASNNWEGLSSDGNIFRVADYYLDQVSLRFETTFNVSLHVVATVPFESFSGSILLDLSDEAINAVGNALSLPNDKWALEPNAAIGNAGADLLIVMTNKTMDHLGVVYGIDGQRFNLAVHARGSKNTGTSEVEFGDIELRVEPGFADNLFQHEISHIFGAEDRWTNEENPSVMTKSRTLDAFADILFGNFWLTQNFWLDEDIRNMAPTFENYD